MVDILSRPLCVNKLKYKSEMKGLYMQHVLCAQFHVRHFGKTPYTI